ncbi:hypothetical protein AB0I68_17810 [Streptomyces sp. NPDC050448]|uniref:hypothetical protein n=1 Tax=Streptomyces sp. NPDC050448 TaxID=3155404 RepID=UPI003416726F
MTFNPNETVYLIQDHKIGEDGWLPKGLRGTTGDPAKGESYEASMNASAKAEKNDAGTRVWVLFENQVWTKVPADVLSNQPA